jgi:hypothetical protein
VGGVSAGGTKGSSKHMEGELPGGALLCFRAQEKDSSLRGAAGAAAAAWV